MKRRKTKKDIRGAEKLVADTLRLYLRGPKDVESEKLSRDTLCLSLEILMDFRTMLDPSRRGKTWVRSIDLSSISIDGASVTGKGTIIWAKENGNREIETSEPFAMSFQTSGSPKRSPKYSLSVG